MSWGIKALIGLAVVTLIASLVGGFWLFMNHQTAELRKNVAEKEAQISALKNQVAGLVADKIKLEVSNASLQRSYDAKVEELVRATKEAATASANDNHNRERLQELQQKLLDNEKQTQLRNIMEGPHYDLLIKYANDNVVCATRNVGRTDGRCVAGRWVLGR